MTNFCSQSYKVNMSAKEEIANELTELVNDNNLQITSPNLSTPPVDSFNSEEWKNNNMPEDQSQRNGSDPSISAGTSGTNSTQSGTEDNPNSAVEQESASTENSSNNLTKNVAVDLDTPSTNNGTYSTQSNNMETNSEIENNGVNSAEELQEEIVDLTASPPKKKSKTIYSMDHITIIDTIDLADSESSSDSETHSNTNEPILNNDKTFYINNNNVPEYITIPEGLLKSDKDYIKLDIVQDANVTTYMIDIVTEEGTMKLIRREIGNDIREDGVKITEVFDENEKVNEEKKEKKNDKNNNQSAKLTNKQKEKKKSMDDKNNIDEFLVPQEMEIDGFVVDVVNEEQTIHSSNIETKIPEDEEVQFEESEESINCSSYSLITNPNQSQSISSTGSDDSIIVIDDDDDDITRKTLPINGQATQQVLQSRRDEKNVEENMVVDKEQTFQQEDEIVEISMVIDNGVEIPNDEEVHNDILSQQVDDIVEERLAEIFNTKDTQYNKLSQQKDDILSQQKDQNGEDSMIVDNVPEGLNVEETKNDKLSQQKDEDGQESLMLNSQSQICNDEQFQTEKTCQKKDDEGEESMLVDIEAQMTNVEQSKNNKLSQQEDDNQEDSMLIDNQSKTKKVEQSQNDKLSQQEDDNEKDTMLIDSQPKTKNVEQSQNDKLFQQDDEDEDESIMLDSQPQEVQDNKLSQQIDEDGDESMLDSQPQGLNVEKFKCEKEKPSQLEEHNRQKMIFIDDGSDSEEEEDDDMSMPNSQQFCCTPSHCTGDETNFLATSTPSKFQKNETCTTFDSTWDNTLNDSIAKRRTPRNRCPPTRYSFISMSLSTSRSRRTYRRKVNDSIDLTKKAMGLRSRSSSRVTRSRSRSTVKRANWVYEEITTENTTTIFDLSSDLDLTQDHLNKSIAIRRRRRNSSMPSKYNDFVVAWPRKGKQGCKQ